MTTVATTERPTPAEVRAMTLGELMDLLKTSNDGGPVVRTHNGVEIRSRCMVTLSEHGHAWHHGNYFPTLGDLIAGMKDHAAGIDITGRFKVP